MSKRSEEKAYEKGQKDGAQSPSRYDPPHGMIEDALTGWGGDRTVQRDNTAYRDGNHHGQKQKK
ncbi:hypothetical protein BH10PSE6_BH10PSE6_09190 [soil metagenome]